MRKKFIFTFTLLLFAIHFFYPQPRLLGDFSITNTEFKTDTIDYSKQNIYYKYSFVSNPSKTDKKQTAFTVLQIGTNFSKFTDLYSLKLDSVAISYNHLKRVSSNEINICLAIMHQINFKKKIIKDHAKNLFTYRSKVTPTIFEYTEKIKLDWKLKPQHKTILNYDVQKATVLYSGRKWIAWFAESIPIQEGPYIFGNLPGLILELYDEKENFHFIVNGIDQKKNPIYKRIKKEIIKTTKKEYLKTEKNYHEKPELFHDTSSTMDKNGAPLKLQKEPYNHIELE